MTSFKYLLLALPLASAPADAAVIAMGNYAAGEFVFAGPGTTLFDPARYRFDVSFTAPPLYLAGDVIKTVTDVFYCIDPENPGPPFYCGGDDVPQTHALTAKSPSLYSTVVNFGPSYIDGDPNGFYTYHFEECCYAFFEFQAIDAGSWVMTVTQVPEPASWALMIGGMALAGGALRRRVGSSASVSTL